MDTRVGFKITPCLRYYRQGAYYGQQIVTNLRSISLRCTNCVSWGYAGE